MKPNFKNLRNLPPAGKDFLKRSLFFLCLYTIICLTHNSLLNALYHFSFVFKDKYLAFLIYPFFLFFGFFIWQRVIALRPYKNNLKQTLVLALCGIAILFLPIKHWIPEMQGGLVAVACFGIYFCSFLFLFLAVFGLKFLNAFFKEIVIISVIYFAFASLQLVLNAYWQYFSWAILWVLKWILLPITKHQASIDFISFNATLNNFSVNIGPVCAGFYSLATFAVLYIIALMALGAKKTIRWFWSVIALLIGLLVVFILNILRVAVIILVGGYISKSLALNLFHEYLGAVFLICVFVVYLYYTIPWLLKNKD